MQRVNPETNTTALFGDLPPRDRQPLGFRWWLFAGVAHLALLALPVTWWSREAPIIDPLVVRLLPSPEAIVPPARRPIPVPSPASGPDPLTPAPETAPNDLPPAVTDIEPAEPGAPPGPEERIPSTAVETLEIQRLLEAVADMDWTVPDAPSNPGRSTTSDVLEAMRAPLLSSTDNAFDGMAAPADTEIVDRWMSPDGVHRVVVRGPDGNTYCGRQEAPNDLRPWLQMPMMFHPCGGGGKRSGGASWRNN